MTRLTLGPEISIGISAFGNHEATRLCLNSLLSAADGDFELILVDDCSPDNGEILKLFLAARDLHRNTRVYRFTTNLEYSGSLNCILSHAGGDKVFFVSNDIYVSREYLSTLIAVAGEAADIGIVRGVSNFVDNGRPTHNVDCGSEITNFQDIPAFATKVSRAQGQRWLADDYLTGDAFLVTRPLLDAIGTFDPMFFGYFADPDFGIRARRAGFRNLLALGAFAFHQRAANFEYLPEDRRQQKLHARWMKVYENWARFKLKYGYPVELPYTGINDLDWAALNGAPARRADVHVPAGDYTRYLVA